MIYLLIVEFAVVIFLLVKVLSLKQETPSVIDKKKLLDHIGTLENLIDDQEDDLGLCLTPVKNFLKSLM